MCGIPTTIESELERMLNEYLDQDYDEYDDYSMNMPCDNYGMCAGTSCSKYFECQGGR